MKKKYQNFIDSFAKHKVTINERLDNHTYFKIGGPADIFIQVHDSQELIKAIKLAIKFKIPYFLLGRGSNILVADKGIRGLVIKNKTSSVRTLGFEGKITAAKASLKSALIQAESGALLNKLSRFSIEESLKGLESFLSIPGTVGGAIYNNSHYRPEKNEFIGNFVHSATIIDNLGNLITVNKDYFKFAYDYSILHQTKDILIKVTLLLKSGQKDKLWKKATKLIKRRNLRQPTSIACSGCTFKNPNSSQSAGFLIDKAGLKGTQVGKARVSDVHASFIENTGGATAKDVLDLIDKVKKEVYKQFKVILDLEIFLVGEF